MFFTHPSLRPFFITSGFLLLSVVLSFYPHSNGPFVICIGIALGVFFFVADFKNWVHWLYFGLSLIGVVSEIVTSSHAGLVFFNSVFVTGFAFVFAGVMFLFRYLGHRHGSSTEMHV